MMESRSLPPLRADLLLIHPPAFFDFRDRRDIYFPFLSTSDAVPITPLYEYYPIGFKTLQRYLNDRGHDIKLINLSTVFLRYPRLSLDVILNALDVKLVGISLHWIVHIQGALAIAERLKTIRPDLPVILGGLSTTYYADELIRYPFVDLIMRGYDTHEPLNILLKALKGNHNLKSIPNLIWKSADGQIQDNGYTYTPDALRCGADWSRQPEKVPTRTFPIQEFLTNHTVGCSHNCGWCGGSRDAVRRIFKLQRAMVRKPQSEIAHEFSTLRQLPDINRYHLYAASAYNHPKEEMAFLLDRVAETNLHSVNYEQFYLPPDDVLANMARANRHTTITLSPESHDWRISKLAGRGAYTNDEMESWLDKALEAGIYQIDIWYFIGMPEQDPQSIESTLGYCERLLKKFKGQRVNPMICPMIPILDPASTFFEQPDRYGYRVFYRTAQEHHRGLGRASLINRLNYETKWLSRSELVYLGYKAVRQLMQAKAENGFLPTPIVERYNAQIDAAIDFIPAVHTADSLHDEKDRARELERLGDEILRRNNDVFFSGVANQAFPVNRDIGGRWFDELGWKDAELNAVLMPKGS